MFTKEFEKYVNSLKQKKYRYQHQRFTAEGTKTVFEFLTEHFEIEKLIATEAWLQQFAGNLNLPEHLIMPVKNHEMKKISSLSNPAEVMLIAVMPEVCIGGRCFKYEFFNRAR